MKLAQKWERENETERLDFVQTYPSSKMRFSEKKGGIRQYSKKKVSFQEKKSTLINISFLQITTLIAWSLRLKNAW